MTCYKTASGNQAFNYTKTPVRFGEMETSYKTASGNQAFNEQHDYYLSYIPGGELQNRKR